MEEKNGKLQKILRTHDIIALAFGAAIGWAWVVLSGDWLIAGGTLGAILGFVIGGIMVLFVGMTYSELCPAMPKCGGEHVFSMRALGFNWSFVCSWALTLSYLGVVAFEAVSLPSVLGHLMPGIYSGYLYTIVGQDIYLPYILVGVAGAALLTWVNYVGIKFASWLQQVLTALILAVGLLMLVASVTDGNIENVQPLFTNGVSGMLSVAVITPFFMVGFDVIPQTAEECNIPPQKLGKLMMLSIVMAAGWYCLIIFCVSTLMPHSQLLSAELCTADALVGAWNGNSLARYIVVLGGMAGILTSWNAFLAAGSRVMYSMGQSGMLPAWFNKLHPKYNTPCNAVLFIGGASMLAPFFGKQLLTWISNAASLSTVIAYCLVAVSFLVLRKKEPGMVRPYRVKHGKVIGAIAVVLSAGMMLLYLPGMPSGLKTPEWILVALWVALGAIMYLMVMRRKSK